MAIDLNNADYRRFTDFASKATSDTTRARLGGKILSETGEAREIKVSRNWDFVGNVGRSAAKKTVNDNVEDGNITGPEDKERTTDGRTITTGFTYTLPKSRFNKISNLDFSKFDDSTAQQIAQSNVNKKMTKAVDTFKKDYIIPSDIGKCNAIFKAELA